MTVLFNKEQEVIESVMQHQEASEIVRKPQEALKRHSVKIILNKETQYSGSESLKQTLK